MLRNRQREAESFNFEWKDPLKIDSDTRSHVSLSRRTRRSDGGHESGCKYATREMFILVLRRKDPPRVCLRWWHSRDGGGTAGGGGGGGGDDGGREATGGRIDG
ncbi:hypothetical protein KPH14_011075 [Odynerus spinipes]|uniref:Uncharacterized protein n=1 Tax=Odynerus spinipes TaxID=1348599 RepID=A0AAD9RH80_9HYME|nr:hypothetical protein KPH14_011075 [Odynerus spinipes]